jgi:hypothetical protein
MTPGLTNERPFERKDLRLFEGRRALEGVAVELERIEQLLREIREQVRVCDGHASWTSRLNLLISPDDRKALATARQIAAGNRVVVQNGDRIILSHESPIKVDQRAHLFQRLHIVPTGFRGRQGISTKAWADQHRKLAAATGFNPTVWDNLIDTSDQPTGFFPFGQRLDERDIWERGTLGFAMEGAEMDSAKIHPSDTPLEDLVRKYRKRLETAYREFLLQKASQSETD